MKKIKIKDTEFTFADSWETITFGQYNNIINYTLDKNLTLLEKTLRLIASVSNDDVDCYYHLMDLTPIQFKELELNFLWIDSDIEYLSKLPPKESLEIKGRNFIIRKNNNSLTLGDMINLESLLENYKNLTNFEVALGILIKEIDSTGKEIEFDEDKFIEKLIFLKENVLLKEVYGILVFFSSGEIKPISSSLHFSE